MSNAVISDFEVLTGHREGQRFPSCGIALSLDWEAEKGRSKKQMVNEVRRAAFSNVNSAVGCIERGDKENTESCKEQGIKEWGRKQ